MASAPRAPELLERLVDAALDEAKDASAAVLAFRARADELVSGAVGGIDWLAAVRDEASLLGERATLARRRATAALRHAGSRDPSAAVAPRAAGLWALPSLPSEAEAAQQVWRAAAKERSATLLEEAQLQLTEDISEAEGLLGEAVAAAERAVAAELVEVQARLERALAQSNASLALALAQLEQAG